jgi:ribonuclease HI
MTDDLPQVTITADGAARGNPGPGGWAALLEAGGQRRLLSGQGPERTTNNAMELTAVAAALEALTRPCRVTLRLDSRYVLDGLERLRAGGALPAANRELWERLRRAAEPHTITFAWVRGHSGDPRNDEVDRAANAAANRAYLAAEGEPAPATAETWTLAILAPGTGRPARWALLASGERRAGDAPVRAGTQPTAVYQALVAGLEAARELPGAGGAQIEVVSNYELVVKQGRGEWQVKQPAQQALAARVAALRDAFAGVRFRYAPTAAVQALLAPADRSGNEAPGPK